jgi:hypothetical protein
VSGSRAADGADPARREVEELRADIGETVEELVHRADVPTRLREKRAETTERVQAQVTRAREVVATQAAEKGPAVQSALQERPAVVGGVLAALLLLVVRSLRRRRRNRKGDSGGTR